MRHPIDRLLLDEATPYASATRIAVLDDPTGLLCQAVIHQWPRAVVAAQCDSLIDERAVAAATAGAAIRLTSDRTVALTGADLVLLRLPTSADALAETAELAALHGSPTVQLVGGARIKHLTRALNGALACGFTEVRASLGRDKSRVLHASGPRADVTLHWPRRRQVAEVGLEVYAHGGVFAGTRVDRGTRLLLAVLADWTPPSGTILDLGCGTGILAGWLAQRHPGADIVASDVSAAAVSSTSQTATSVRCQRSAGLDGWAAGSLGAIVTNPPFHVGPAKDSTPTLQAIRDARIALRAGGELIMVFNAHLPYLPRLRHLGSTAIVARDRDYLVTRSVRSG